MSDILHYNNSFGDDDTIQHLSFENDASFVDRGGVVDESCYVPASLASTAGASVRSGTSVHDMIRSAGIQLSSSQQPAAFSQQPSDIPAMYPHCERHFTDDFDYFLQVNWNRCTAGQIYDICTSPHLQCGATKSMAYVLSFAIKALTGELACFCLDDSKALKALVAKNTRPSLDLRNAFEKCCAGVGVLESLRRTMSKYTQNKSNVIKWRPGVVPEENPNLLDQMRLASIMIDPRFDSYRFIC